MNKLKCQQSKNEKQIWAMYWFPFRYFSSYVNHLRLYQVMVHFLDFEKLSNMEKIGEEYFWHDKFENYEFESDKFILCV